ncbi:hypothetical protein BDZ90DRAFT_233802 [Jaminaea rosea]|uniref:Uncharacterized protein n=1 Tax=Jaminaea rosea TaxID=1569628 RepID=A0A316UKN0_9BASI|nr:hypothetical protein BDZ90DRAFT_233802 [Jaminaea rosea]PWN25790.1 hypothetical protein BDZ90DRAFT_233802 [Jaminaea rosea]
MTNRDAMPSTPGQQVAPPRPAQPVSAATTTSSSVTASPASRQASMTQTPSRPSSAADSRIVSAGPAASSAALYARLRWNLVALLLLFLVPRITQSKRIYWSLLDLVYSALGNRADEHLDSSLAWLRWAASILFLINAVEAGAHLLFHSTTQKEIAAAGGKTAPSLARPPGHIDVKPAPPPTRSKDASEKAARRYSPHSPLRASLEAAARNASSSSPSSSSPGGSPLAPRYSTTSSPSGGLLQQRRLPSGPPSNASPLAAYLARRSLSSATHGGRADMSTLSFDSSGAGGDDSLGDVSSDSFEVDRALRVLSGSYAREQMNVLVGSTGKAATPGQSAPGTDTKSASQAPAGMPPQTPLFQRSASGGVAAR